MASETRVLPDQAMRDRIVQDLDQNLLVEAAAGTGKTTSLIQRMVALLRAGKCEVENLAAVTFTRKAAAEIRTRFQLELERQAATAESEEQERMRRAIAFSQRCFIGTIHAFCGQLLRERPVEANLDPSFGELDESQDEALKRQTWRDYVEHLIATNAPVLPELARVGLKISASTQRSRGIASELEAVGLEPIHLGAAFVDFAKYADVTDWPTRVTQFPDFEPVKRELLAYVAHMNSLKLPADPGKDSLMPAYRKVCTKVRYTNLDEPAKLISVLEMMDKKGDATYKWWPGNKAQAKPEEDRWNAFRATWVKPTIKAFLEHRYDIALRTIKPALDRYDQTRRQMNVLNFQDLLIQAAKLLREHPPVRKYFRSRFSHLLVDEFQDTDPIQAEVMLLLTADDPAEPQWQRCRPVPGSLFVVGDPKQSIYRFRRADILTYNKVRQTIEAVGGAVLPLSANFRSTPQIIEWVNGVFDQKFPAQANDYSPANRPLEVGRDLQPQGPLAGVFRLVIPGSPKVADAMAAEALWIARTIRKALDEQWPITRSDEALKRGVPPHATPGDFMVITWKKKNLTRFARALEQLRIPHQVTGGALLNEVPELALLYQLLRCLTRPDDEIALVAVLRSELFGLPDTWLYRFRKLGGKFAFTTDPPEELPEAEHARFAEIFARLREYALWFKRYPAVSAVERICAETGLIARAAAATEGEAHAGSLLKALELLRHHEASFTSVDVVEAMGRFARKEEIYDGATTRPPGEDVVQVMNLHQCKGLEAPIVFLADPAEIDDPRADFHIDRSGNEPRGYLPIYGPKKDQYAKKGAVHALPPDWDELEAIEKQFLEAEVKRLLYVAATRAGSGLVISQNNRKSRWNDFAQYLSSAPALPDPGNVELPPATPPAFDVSAWANEITGIRARWQTATAPSYDLQAVKSLAITTMEKPHGAEAHGAEWGNVIHTLLETVMRSPGLDLRTLAISALEEEELSLALLDDVLRTVEVVQQSPLWQRAQSAQQCLVEVPLGTFLPPDPQAGLLPTSVRGVIDLAFREPDGWVIVDYKSERVEQSKLDLLVDYYRPQLVEYGKIWQRLTSQQVKELGIFFTHTGEYRTTEPA